MLTNADCTVYRYNKANQGFDRYYIPAVMWRESKGANVLKSGLQSIDSVTVFISAQYVKSAPKTPAKDMLVKGNCDFVFDNTSLQTVSESLKTLRAQRDFVTVSAVDEMLYGGLPHIEVSAK